MEGGSPAPVGTGDRERAIATLVDAFTEDPVERWLWPGDEEYRTHFATFVTAFGGAAFGERTVYELDGFTAVSFWFAPGVEPDAAAIGAVLAETVDESKHEDLFATAAQMEAAHPRFEHWYLPWLGTTRSAQGSGVGGRLLDAGLATVDAASLPAYLETPNPRVVPFYERHGFEVTTIAQSGDFPPLTCMQRAARQ